MTIIIKVLNFPSYLI